MITLEFKAKTQLNQAASINEAMLVSQFVRNKCLRYWMDNRDSGRYDLNKLCPVIAKEFPFANKLNSTARQASAERAWRSVSGFFSNCKRKIAGKKGYPKFKKDCRSVEYKTSGWKLSDDRKKITFTDGFKIGTLKLKGTRNLNHYAKDKIKRVRIIKRADGYYVQFCIDADRHMPHSFNGSMVGVDMNLENFYTDSNGNVIANPRFLRKCEKSVKKAQRSVSNKVKGSNNRKKAINKLGRKHLKIQRQRKDFAVKTARALVQSNDLIVFEDLKVKNMVKNHCFAKSISDASWSMFIGWVKYFGKLSGVPVLSVAPHYTSQECSGCHAIVKKSLSTRTHSCKCGLVLSRDHNAAINILTKGLNELSTAGHAGIDACGDNNLYSIVGNYLEQVGSLKQESKESANNPVNVNKKYKRKNRCQ